MPATTGIAASAYLRKEAKKQHEIPGDQQPEERSDASTAAGSVVQPGNTHGMAGGGVGTMPGPDGKPVYVPSIAEIHKILPADCLGGDAWTSMYYAARSVVYVAALGFAFNYLRATDIYASNPLAAWAIVSAYWFLQGTVFWGIFTLGHDCGHGSFSSSSRLNWVVGNALHTFILVPYESWRVSHRHHHKNTGHIDNDEIFFPLRESEMHRGVKMAPMMLGVAWFYYVLRGHYPRNVFHLNPNDPLFVHYKSQGRVTCSVVSMALWVGFLIVLAKSITWSVVSTYYFAPLMVFATWLVITTFLHHQEENTPWFADGTWDYVKGNLSSIDRSYWPFDDVVHNIGTHQLHHLFPIVPHYKLKKATEAFRAAYPKLVRKSDALALPAFFKSLRIYVRQTAIAKGANYWVFQ